MDLDGRKAWGLGREWGAGLRHQASEGSLSYLPMQTDLVSSLLHTCQADSQKPWAVEFSGGIPGLIFFHSIPSQFFFPLYPLFPVQLSSSFIHTRSHVLDVLPNIYLLVCLKKNNIAMFWEHICVSYKMDNKLDFVFFTFFSPHSVFSHKLAAL